MSAPITRVEGNLSFQRLGELPIHTIQSDWYGNSSAHQVTFQLGASETDLVFGVKVYDKPWCNPSLSQGEYIEGLWKNDVAELFLRDDHSEAYQEFNLAPTGAWWSMLFSHYRAEDRERFSAPSNIRCTSNITDDSWEAAILIPRNELSIQFASEAKSWANVCFITGEEGKRQYFSWCLLGGDKPDFHLMK